LKSKFQNQSNHGAVQNIWNKVFDELPGIATCSLEKGQENLGAHRGVEGEADDSGMNVDVGQEAKGDADHGVRSAAEEANDASESFRRIPRARM
jgi:hypothetical protein